MGEPNFSLQIIIIIVIRKAELSIDKFTSSNINMTLKFEIVMQIYKSAQVDIYVL